MDKIKIMITEKEIKQILKKKVTEVSDIVQLLVCYIHERKGIEVNLDPFFEEMKDDHTMYFLQKYYLILANHVLNFYTVKYNLKEYLLFHPKN